MTTPLLLELAHAALQGQVEYLKRVEDRLQEFNKNNPVDPIAFLGPGRTGKDTAAEFWAKTYMGYRYGGSSSQAALPFVRHALMSLGFDWSPEEVWNCRHESREFWFEFLNAIRAFDPSVLVRISRSEGNIVVGIRSDIELATAVMRGHIKHLVWIENPNIAPDPTMEYGEEQVLKFRNSYTLYNADDLASFHETLQAFAPMVLAKSRIQ